ncbi:hypothetical protein DQ384_38075 [Sphaerisporangium album]|uniref:Uncharacterized protein n=1 Tax=Sphaerisporangium album TaxID=509200 RepID=A0A367EM27_9ACTN|nr:hypothetical protein DQ384_38075 [Sphaerisporangium album]
MRGRGLPGLRAHRPGPARRRHRRRAGAADRHRRRSVDLVRHTPRLPGREARRTPGHRHLGASTPRAGVLGLTPKNTTARGAGFTKGGAP